MSSTGSAKVGMKGLDYILLEQRQSASCLRKMNGTESYQSREHLLEVERFKHGLLSYSFAALEIMSCGGI